jgi:hypothetical protein
MISCDLLKVEEEDFIEEKKKPFQSELNELTTE